MTLLRLLLRTSRGLAIMVLCSSILAGLSSTFLIATIYGVLKTRSSPSLRFFALCVALFLLDLTARQLLLRIGQRALYDMRLDLSRRVLLSPLRQLEQIGSHRIFSVLSDNINQVVVSLVNLPGVIAGAIVIVACLIYLSSLWLAGGLIAAGFLVTSMVLTSMVRRRGWRALYQIGEVEQEVFGHFRALVEGAKELKLHHLRREEFAAMIARTSATVRDEHVRALGILQWSVSWGNVFAFLLVGLSLFVGPRLFAVDWTVLDGFAVGLIFISPFVTFILLQIPILGQAVVAMQKAEALGLSILDENIAPRVAELPPWSHIELAGLHLAYESAEGDSHFALGPLDLTLRRGELLFVVGGNGSGKSTLAKLITGLYVPDAGAIRLDDRPVTDENRESYRQLFSAVFADFYLFERMLGIVSPDLDERARVYIARLQLESKVSVKDGVLSTTALSQGQRKRLALLTAWLEDRPVMVFDEWAADQDPAFREVFYSQLLPELKQRGKTVVVITHDDRYFGCADRIIKLESGQLVATTAGAR